MSVLNKYLEIPNQEDFMDSKKLADFVSTRPILQLTGTPHPYPQTADPIPWITKLANSKLQAHIRHLWARLRFFLRYDDSRRKIFAFINDTLADKASFDSKASDTNTICLFWYVVAETSVIAREAGWTDFNVERLRADLPSCRAIAWVALLMGQRFQESDRWLVQLARCIAHTDFGKMPLSPNAVAVDKAVSLIQDTRHATITLTPSNTCISIGSESVDQQAPSSTYGFLRQPQPLFWPITFAFDQTANVLAVRDTLDDSNARKATMENVATALKPGCVIVETSKKTSFVAQNPFASLGGTTETVDGVGPLKDTKGGDADIKRLLDPIDGVVNGWILRPDTPVPQDILDPSKGGSVAVAKGWACHRRGDKYAIVDQANNRDVAMLVEYAVERACDVS